MIGTEKSGRAAAGASRIRTAPPDSRRAFPRPAEIHRRWPGTAVGPANVRDFAKICVFPLDNLRETVILYAWNGYRVSIV